MLTEADARAAVDPTHDELREALIAGEKRMQALLDALDPKDVNTIHLYHTANHVVVLCSVLHDHLRKLPNAMGTVSWRSG